MKLALILVFSLSSLYSDIMSKLSESEKETFTLDEIDAKIREALNEEIEKIIEADRKATLEALKAERKKAEEPPQSPEDLINKGLDEMLRKKQ